MGNNTVEGSNLNDIMALGYTDPSDGEMITDQGERIRAFDGDDTVVAGGGADRAWGGDGDDLMIGQAGNDRLAGDAGDDLLFGVDGDDKLIGGRGNDLLDGGPDNDMLWGNKGNNTLIGGEGDDTIEGGDQSSTLEGGDGEDRLLMRAKKGADHTATGGNDADTFVFELLGLEAQADMTITDFELGVDSFEAEGVPDWLYTTFLDETAVTEDEGDAVLTLTTGDTVRFEGVTEAEFEAFYGLNEEGPPPGSFYSLPVYEEPFEFIPVHGEPLNSLAHASQDDGWLS